MKKILTLIAAVLAVQSVSAQKALEESSTWDNWYIGIQGGAAVKTTGVATFKNLNPGAGLRIGRYITPVVGFAVEGETGFSNKPYYSRNTIVRNTLVNGLATINLSNWFGGYKGEPRTFEFVAIAGAGWGHRYGHLVPGDKDRNFATTKAGLDLTFNLGKEKAWQIYVEPAIVYAHNLDDIAEGFPYNVNHSFLSALVGLNYKFRNSNKTHNFKYATVRDQAEIDALNKTIEGLKENVAQRDKALTGKDQTIAGKDNEIASLKEQLTACENKPAVKAQPNIPQLIVFGKGQTAVAASQQPTIQMIAGYLKNHPDSKVVIKGYASPEGSKEVNDRISRQRAENVKNALVRAGIKADRLEAIGLGATDDLFPEPDFNRVATFEDVTVQK